MDVEGDFDGHLLENSSSMLETLVAVVFAFVFFEVLVNFVTLVRPRNLRWRGTTTNGSTMTGIWRTWFPVPSVAIA